MMADPIGLLMKRATCCAAFAVIIETCDTAQERKKLIMFLWERNIISEQAAELLIEHFSLEAA